MRAGRGVRTTEENSVVAYYADVAGRFVWSGGRLAVYRDYEIQGDIGLKTGHVNHPGCVIVRGDVRAGSEIMTGGDLEVRGHIEWADIQAGGNLVVGGGISGTKSRPMRIAGSVRARYITDARIEAGGHVEVAREVVQSSIKARGTVSAERGRIVGGEIVALQGIRARRVGSPQGLPTRLIAAVDFELPNRVGTKRAEIRRIRHRLSTIRAERKAWMGHEHVLSAEQRHALEELQVMALECRGAIDDMIEEIRAIRQASDAEARPLIEITDRAFHDAILGIKGEQLRLSGTRSGRLSAGLDDGQLVLRSGRYYSVGQPSSLPVTCLAP